jgi:hypothetical protein
MAGKLTEAQKLSLARMAEGDEAWTVSGTNPHAFWKNRTRGRNPDLATLHALERAGLIEDYKRDFTGGQYRITPAGRAALEREKRG